MSGAESSLACFSHPAVAQSQPYNQPWQNFSTRNDLGYPSTSQVNLHAPSAQDERSGFLHDDGGRNSYDAYGGGGVGGRLPDIGSVSSFPCSLESESLGARTD